MHAAHFKLKYFRLTVHLFALLLCSSVAVQAVDKPNILLILLDDVGFSDFGAFGGDISTPNIDQLAENGLRYTNFSSAGVCSPSRAALLTGLNHHSAGVGWLANIDSGHAGYRGEIASNVITLPELLRQNGYATLMVGKWHLSNSIHLTEAGPNDSWPLQRGFEQFWGILDGEANQFAPAFLFRGNQVIDVPYDGRFYFPDAMTDEAISMLREQGNGNSAKPWLMYYATAAAHAPHHTKAKDRRKYLGKYEQGYERQREARLKKQKQLGIVPPDTRLAPTYPGVQAWQDLAANEKKVSVRLQQNYAAFVDNADQQIGRLLEYLRNTGQLNNTLIMLTSDNGGSRETGRVGTTMATRYFNGIEDTTEKNEELFADIGKANSHSNYPHGWMQLSNTPFPYSKATVHGGGVRSPLIVHWPSGIKPKGEIRRQFHHINDLMPTVLELSDVHHPAAAKAMEGISLAYSFDDGEQESQKKEQYYEIEANRAYVSDVWKLVSRVEAGKPYDASPWELYNLKEDFSESHNVADEFPGIVKQLEQKWWRAAKQYQVLPIHDQSIAERGRAALSKLPSIRRKEFEYQASERSVHPIAAPMLRGREFDIDLRLENFEQGQAGVLLAQGGYDVGYTVYVQNNRAYYEVNIGGYRSQFALDRVLPDGDLQITLQFRKAPVKTSANNTATDSLGVIQAEQHGEFSQPVRNTALLRAFINGEKAGTAVLSPALTGSTWEGLDIGADRRTAVSKQYRAPFVFNGDLRSVRYHFQ